MRFGHWTIILTTCGLLSGSINPMQGDEFLLHGRQIVFSPDSTEGLRTLRTDLHRIDEESSPVASSKEPRGVRAISNLVDEALQAPEGSSERAARLVLLREVMAAMHNNLRSPVPERMDFFEFPLQALIHTFNPVGVGSVPAGNITSSADPDRGLRDPATSPFWRRPGSISNLDLYSGFGRTARPDLRDTILVYLRPKRSYGSNPGFDAVVNGRKLKAKFGELHSEPFTTRIFDALGFHADPTDYVQELCIRYDRRLFLEFNSRKPFEIQFRVFGLLPAYRLQLQPHHDPFQFVTGAVLRNGAQVRGDQLRARLLVDPQRDDAAGIPDNFRPEFEAEIDHLIMRAANIQFENESVKSLGPWDYMDLGHADRRELRGVALLAAWLGWFDTRFGNTQLKIANTTSGQEYLHYFSDLGGGLGSAEGFFSGQGERPNEFGWICTERFRADGGRGPWTRFRITGYRPIENNPAFRAMTIDDARWMARLIGQLTEKQLVEALVGSGFDSAEVKLYTEKLISRRDTMIRQLELDSDIPLLRPHGINRNFEYDPVVDGPVKVVSASGDLRVAQVGSARVMAGRLEKLHQ